MTYNTRRFKIQHINQNLGHKLTDERTDKEHRQDEAIARARGVIVDAATTDQSFQFVAEMDGAADRNERIAIIDKWQRRLSGDVSDAVKIWGRLYAELIEVEREASEARQDARDGYGWYAGDLADEVDELERLVVAAWNNC